MCTLEEVNTKLLSENEELHRGMMQLKKEYKVISFNSLVTLNTVLLAMLSKAIWNSCHYVSIMCCVGPPGRTCGKTNPIICCNICQHAQQQHLCQQRQSLWHNYCRPGPSVYSSSRNG